MLDKGKGTINVFIFNLLISGITFVISILYVSFFEAIFLKSFSSITFKLKNDNGENCFLDTFLDTFLVSKFSFLLDTFLYFCHFLTPFLFSTIIYLFPSLPFLIVPTVYNVALLLGDGLSFLYFCHFLTPFLFSTIIYLFPSLPVLIVPTLYNVALLLGDGLSLSIIYYYKKIKFTKFYFFYIIFSKTHSFILII